MIVSLIDKKIREAFSNSALQYEVLAGLQKEIGRELVKQFEDQYECQYVLDVGMGPGWLSNRLSNLFSEAKVLGVDVAAGMTQVAKKKYDHLNVFQADARHLPFDGETFDIVTSNLAYQWVPNIDTSFRESYRTLKKNGLFCFTMFGYETLKELFSSIEQCLDSKDEQIVHRLVSKDQVELALRQAGFDNIEIKKEIIKAHFPDMFDLMKWLKGIGANAMQKNIYIGKELLQKSSAVYDRTYRDRLGIYATFEVLWIKSTKS